MDLNSSRIFVYVVNRGGFTAASKVLRMPVATISRKVSELEKAIGVRLLERSTRSVRLTEAGAIYFDFTSRALHEFESGMLALSERENELRGTLRISIPPDFEPWWSLLEDFQREFPNISIDVYVTERKLDLVGDGIDVALRVGSLDTQTAIGRNLCSYSHKLIASRQFVEQFGQPNSIAELSKFPLAAWGKKDQNIVWFEGKDKISVEPRIRSNEYSHIRYLLLTHQFITEVPPFLVPRTSEGYEIVEILPQHKLPKLDINLLYPSRKNLSRIARMYIDYCIQNFMNYVDKVELG